MTSLVFRCGNGSTDEWKLPNVTKEREMKWKPGPFDARALPSYYTVLCLTPSHASDQKAGGHTGTFKWPMHLI